MKSPATKNPNRAKFGSATEFASFGNGALSYVRRVRSDDLNHRFPNAVDLPVDMHNTVANLFEFSVQNQTTTY